MGIYKDIQTFLEKEGSFVNTIIKAVDPHDPYYSYKPLNNFLYNKKKYLGRLKAYWEEKLNEEEYEKVYDYLFVINGTFVHPVLFSILKSRNPNIRCINYLVDSTRVYRFDRLFHYYDKVLTFDREDALRFKLSLYPIYWIPEEKVECPSNTFDIFAMGGFKYDRYLVYQKVKRISNQYGLNSFIKIYLPPSKGIWHIFKSKLHNLINLGTINLDAEIVTETPLPPEVFRKFISSSHIIVDTILEKQVGLTSRLLWAVGMGKKVITTNKDIVNYPFYNPSRFFVLTDTNSDIPSSFIKDVYVETESERTIIDEYRIDNWINNILS